jgi:hypothetical protein
VSGSLALVGSGEYLPAKYSLEKPGDSVLVGIDELTAMVRRSGQSQWRVFGEAKVHILKGLTTQQLSHDEEIPFG